MTEEKLDKTVKKLKAKVADLEDALNIQAADLDTAKSAIKALWARLDKLEEKGVGGAENPHPPSGRSPT